MKRSEWWTHFVTRRPLRSMIRFTRHIEFAENGCWLWTSNLDRDGYAKYGMGGQRAHCLAFAWAFAPAPKGMTLDHGCRNRRCVNPSHLTVMTSVENVMIGETFVARNRAKTICDHGHEFTPDNTRIVRRPDGRFRQRECRACRRRIDRDYKEAARARNEA